jgi:hypothetical protein
MALVRRWVEMPRRAPGKGGQPRTWAYGYPELAALLEMTEGAVRQAVRRDQFNPADLASVVDFVVRRRPPRPG